MLRIPHEIADRGNESEHEYQEHRRESAYYTHRCREHSVGILAFLICKTEECRFHSESKDDEYKRYVCIEIGHHTISTTFGRNNMSVKWHKQIVEESACNGGETVYCGVLKDFKFAISYKLSTKERQFFLISKTVVQ